MQRLPFIRIKKNEIFITGGLVFCHDFIYQDALPEEMTYECRINNNYFIGACPEWWQLIEWFKLCKTIYNFFKFGIRS